MDMAFGNKMGSLKALKKTLAKGGGGGQWIKYIPKNGSINVRFLTEPEEWLNYSEHYDETLRKSYPCNGMSSCPGCKSGDRKSSRYLVNAIDLDADSGVGRAIALQLPKDLANRLVVKYEKWGTLVDRDIELTRSGEGLDTIYDLDPSVPTRRKMDKFQPHDLEKVLQDAWDEVHGAGDDDDEDDEDEPVTTAARRTKRPAAAPASKGRRTSAAVKALADEDAEEDDDDEDEEEDDEPTPPAPKRRPAKKAPEPVFEADDEDDEDDEDEEADDEEDDEDEAEEEEAEYTIEELQAMPLGALRKVAREEFGLDTTGKTKAKLIKEIEAIPPF